MDNLAPRILGLVTRLSGPEPPGAASPPPLNRQAIEGTYRQALRLWFELTAQGPDAEPAEVSRVYQEILRLIDEVGEPRATALRREGAPQWYQETGVCPYCGERGVYHDPEQSGEGTA